MPGVKHSHLKIPKVNLAPHLALVFNVAGVLVKNFIGSKLGVFLFSHNQRSGGGSPELAWLPVMLSGTQAPLSIQASLASSCHLWSPDGQTSSSIMPTFQKRKGKKMGNLWYSNLLMEDTNKATISQPPLKSFPRSDFQGVHLPFIGKTVSYGHL